MKGVPDIFTPDAVTSIKFEVDSEWWAYVFVFLLGGISTLASFNDIQFPYTLALSNYYKMLYKNQDANFLFRNPVDKSF